MLTQVVCKNSNGFQVQEEMDVSNEAKLLQFVNNTANSPLVEFTDLDIIMQSLNLVIEVRHLDDFPFDEGGLTMVTSKVDGVAVQTVTHPNFFGPVELETLV
jgi:hypothetical protein